MKKILTICILLSIGIHCQGQMLASQNKSAEVELVPENPEKLSKLFSDMKMKTTISSKESVITSHSITFYTSAFYKYTGKGAGGNVGGQVGYVLRGISDDTFQSIADETKDYLQSQLKAYGYSFEDYSTFLNAKNIDKLQSKAGKPGVEEEVQNPNFTKKVKARTFTAGNKPVYPGIVGTPAYFKAVQSMKANAIISNFSINFLSFGQKISSNRVADITTGQMLLESSIHGSGSLQILTPKLKMGEIKQNEVYRHPAGDAFYATEEIEDGYRVIKADEAKYKMYCVELINSFTDLMIDYMNELK